MSGSWRLSPAAYLAAALAASARGAASCLEVGVPRGEVRVVREAADGEGRGDRVRG